ncbi:T9SS outer membrane translocon Sov/SprA [Segetibacter aerophilus]|uniref:T9SS outer membrane translocon Sov/SprA n=1 Tax=Segetibacter aerophilus TaxID=670293 RepID=UPI0011BF62FE|nr:cell surface protein SprA [Segetibacter aerophilus]
MSIRYYYKFSLIVSIILSAFGATCSYAQDTSRRASRDTTRFPISDRVGDPFTYNSNNPFNLSDTAYIKRDIQYDPKTKQYYIVEKIGNSYYRTPTYMTFEEMMRFKARQSESEYFRKRANTLSVLNRKVERPKLKTYDKLFDRIFGVGPNGLKVDIRPQGNVDITAGYEGQNIKNPTLPESARKNGGFDFNMNSNINVIANIGDKLKLPINYNTLANFDFENQLKLDYKGMDDEIIKSIEAGNVSFTSKGTLIPSAQSLFGLKTQLQFGKLFLSGVIATQKAQRQSLALQGGAATSTFNKKLDDYEENRHFLLGDYFRANYNKAMENLPVVNTQVQIQRMEVWVTNRTGATTETRDVVGLMDLGEGTPFNTRFQGNGGLPANGANNLYTTLINQPGIRNPVTINANLMGIGLRPVEDYEKTFARKLSPNEYYFNPQIGFVSLNQQLQSDEVLGVAYQYTYNGRVYQVGEFSQDVALDSTQGVQKVLLLKLLKATSQRPALPIWKWMMKNVYSLDLPGIQRQDFKLNILYQEPSGGLKRFLPESANSVEGRTLLRILNLDRLNNQNDPLPDGVFDYVEGFTVLSQQGKIIFPVLEPFGRDLERLAFTGTSDTLRNKYVYRQLYDSIKAIAQTYANLNRYVMQGAGRGNSTSEIYLGAFNVPPGSVTVTAGGQILREGFDYSIDYNLGTVKILNGAILNSGIPVNVQFENNAGFGMQQRSFLGLRADYLANRKLALGATMARLSERPFFTKMNYGEDPIRNTMYGVDFNYRTESPSLTRLLNKLPFYQSNVMSTINAYGEAAFLKPGHPPQIGSGSNGLIYVDDFEGTRNNIDLRFPFISWALASTPQGNGLFPEATLADSLPYNFNRAKLAWYNIEPILQDRNSVNNPLRRNVAELSDPRVRAVYNQELYPQRTNNLGENQLVTFDLAYYPTDIGPYNFVSDQAQVDASGKLKNPRQRWGGIMRSIDQTDFETSNVEFVEFWVQDPFIKKPNSTGGKLYLNLGSISEDVLKDSRRFYENGLNSPNQPSAVDNSSTWGRTPVNPIQVTQAFSNDPADRPFQDVGFDGLDDAGEAGKRAGYLNSIRANFGPGSALYARAQQDPSNDNYKWYRDNSYDATNTGILGRYKNFNNPQGNSPIATGNSQFSPAATLYPDNEDLNRDNTLNETEEYYQYAIDLKPGMDVGNTKYITDRQVIPVRYADGSSKNENWYLFRVPIADYEKKVGNIPDFKSIRFVRMFLTDFEDSVVLRFARLDLVRNQWRNFAFKLDTAGNYVQQPRGGNTTFNVLAVNVEENSKRQPVNYLIPPGIERVQQLSNNGINLLQNEQAMSFQIRNLATNDVRAVFKTMNLDMRQYGSLHMFVHAESTPSTIAQPIKNNQLNAVIRIGSDFLNNYYEIKIPLTVTPPGNYPNTDAGQRRVWPDSNNLDFDIQDLVQLKMRRNSRSINITNYYQEIVGNKTYAIKGNPNLGEVQAFLIGVENSQSSNGIPASAEVWVNELRLSKLDEKGGYAATGRVDIALADLGTIAVSGSTHTTGFGSLEQRVNERARENFMQYDIATNLEMGRLLPKKLGISIPLYASINQTITTPEYDPYDLDIKLKDKLNGLSGKDRTNSKNAAIDKTTIKTVNFTNMRVMPTGKTKIWSISNFDFSYSYIKYEQTNPLILKNDVVKHRGGLGYTFNKQPKYFEPFKRIIKSKSPWFALVRDFNVNPQPSLLSFRADVNRQFGTFVPRIVNSFDNKVDRVDTTFDKFFTFDRYYNLRWDLTKSLNIDFSAVNNARIDEPIGSIDTRAKKDTVRTNFMKGGRNTLYQQRAIASYTFPLTKLPLTNWMNARYSYTTTYNWIGASRLAISLGNTIENSQENNITGELDFTRLYAKSRWLRALDQAPAPQQGNPQDPNAPGRNKRTPQNANPANPPAAVSTLPTREEVIKGLSGKEKRVALRKWRKQRREERKAARLLKAAQPVEMPGIARAGGQLLTMVKHATVNFGESYRSRIPGYTDSTKILGQNWNTMAPGLDFVFGRQPDSNWLNQKAARGLITRDTTLNFMFRQSIDQKINVTAQLEPIREFLVDLNMEKTYTKDYSELFKTVSQNGKFEHLSPLATGGFNVSYIAFKTLFTKNKPTEISQTFRQFEAYRLILSERLALANPYQKGLGNNPDGFYKGYNRYAQDVLIPAFIAAYSGQDPKNVGLIQQSNPNIKSNPFASIKPKPNWRVTYTGLTRLPALAKTFSAISITHAYNGSLGMNSFNSALNFTDPFAYSAPGFIDTISGNFVPFFLVPNITIQESFSPLLGIDVTTVSQLTASLQYRKTRQLSLSLVDYQLSEVNSTEITLGGSFRKRGFNLPFKIPGTKGKKLQNDVNFRLDLSIRDDATSNSRLDQDNAFSTGGQKVVTLQPSIDYVLNNRVNIKLYFDQRKVVPYISTSAPITNTRAGVQIRISLAQ